MAVKAVKVDRNTNEVTVISTADDLPLKRQELMTDEADQAAVKHAPKLGLSRAGIRDSRMSFRHPDTLDLIEDPRRFYNNSANKDIVLEPVKIYKLG